jgi:hypothetical protein
MSLGNDAETLYDAADQEAHDPVFLDEGERYAPQVRRPNRRGFGAPRIPVHRADFLPDPNGWETDDAGEPF